MSKVEKKIENIDDILRFSLKSFVKMALWSVKYHTALFEYDEEKNIPKVIIKA